MRVSSFPWTVSFYRIKPKFSDTNMLNTEMRGPWF